VEVYFSGGRKVRNNGAVEYDTAALYKDLDVPRDRVLTLDEMRRRPFDMAVCAHTKGFFPEKRCPRVQIFHGVSFRNAAVRTPQREYDTLFAVGPYQLRALRRLRIAGRRAVEVGFPKLDALLNGSLSREKILADAGFKGNRPVILYAPTGQVANSLEIMGEEAIDRIRRSGAFDLLVKPHDHPKNSEIDWFERLRKFEGPHVRLVRTFDVVPYLYAADLLISDASSVANEYTLLDRPIVFLDVPKLISNVRRKKKGMLDLHTYGRKTGITVRKPREVVSTMRWFLDHPEFRSSIRRKVAQDLFFNPGRATEVAVGWIVNRLRQEHPWLGD
jgi:CDP-glycerol glycerophosphotransferase (TagB/SpsB family)